MAYFHYLSEVTNDCLLSSFKSLLEEAGLIVSQEFSNHVQIFAEDRFLIKNHQSKVKVLISWSDRNNKQCSIEIRSDEPHLKKDTYCEKVATMLRDIIPPKEIYTNGKFLQENHEN